ncbi:hypothetical protein IAR55_000885 [Kwoniella newhampshirensis]|uniref:BZIP domain-containing protein n=1 Tax=Kwoniella newhampshirensis TaxID=1651941 RepID=A0AAW0Z4A8_9TREE
MSTTTQHPPLPLSPPDKSSLETLIRQLKRSPESPSRLTLPPIMGVLDDDCESDTDPTCESTEDREKGREHFGCGLGLSDMSEVDGVGNHKMGMGKLWTLEEEEEEEEEESDEHVDRNRSSIPAPIFVDPDFIDSDSLQPIDPFSPPPPSPRLNQVLSPVIPNSPSLPSPNFDTASFSNADDQENDETVDPQHRFEERCLPERINLTEYDESGEIHTSIPISLELSPQLTVQRTRRRRRTLSDLEQYRKFAMNKAAWKLQHELERAEERKKEMDRLQVMQRRLWISTRRKFQRSSGGMIQIDHSQPMLRAQSFPPCKSKSSSACSSKDDDSSCSNRNTPIDPEDDHSPTTKWAEENQCEHLEYASESDPMSPVSPVLETPTQMSSTRLNNPSTLSYFKRNTGQQISEDRGLGFKVMTDVLQKQRPEGGRPWQGGDREDRYTYLQAFGDLPHTLGLRFVTDNDDTTSRDTFAPGITSRESARHRDQLRRGGVDLGDSITTVEDAMFAGFGFDWTLESLEMTNTKPLLGLGLTTSSSFRSLRAPDPDIWNQYTKGLPCHRYSTESTPDLATSPEDFTSVSILLTPPTPLISTRAGMTNNRPEVASPLIDDLTHVSEWQPRHTSNPTIAKSRKGRRRSSPDLVSAPTFSYPFDDAEEDKIDSTGFNTASLYDHGEHHHLGEEVERTRTRSAPPSPKLTHMTELREEER